MLKRQVTWIRARLRPAERVDNDSAGRRKKLGGGVRAGLDRGVQGPASQPSSKRNGILSLRKSIVCCRCSPTEKEKSSTHRRCSGRAPERRVMMPLAP
eukprot:5799960-Amphidinium_carterae.1